MTKPNILFIMTDQQSRHMMSCAGYPYVKTPAMDSLAESGTRFTRAYATNPVCIPSRFSLVTGRMPSEIKLQANLPVRAPERIDDIAKSGLGWTLKNGGYDAVFAGKQHFPKMNAEDLGFDVLTLDERDELAEKTADFVTQDHGKPWCLVASFINPHDICYMAIRDHAEGGEEPPILRYAKKELAELDNALALADAYSESEFYEKHCPPLPPNFDSQKDEPEALRGILNEDTFRANARDNWPDQRWRMHRWVYAKLTERVDGQIQILLNALRSGPNAENTVIIFTSDHGDHDASHHLEHKTMPYEEAAGVPMIVCQPGMPGGVIDDSNLISNGLDIYPTICDYAGIDIPSYITGRSLRPLVEGIGWTAPRPAIPVECQIGNAVIAADSKYMKCFEGENAEQLYDLVNDPYETRNSIDNPELQTVLENHRKHFAELHPDHADVYVAE